MRVGLHVRKMKSDKSSQSRTRRGKTIFRSDDEDQKWKQDDNSEEVGRKMKEVGIIVKEESRQVNRRR